MARIRSVKPELRESLVVSSWPIPVRYAWVLLLGYLDDHGRGRDDIGLLKAGLFPRDRDVTESKLDGWLGLMCQPDPEDGIPPLCRYEVTGGRYIHAPKWRIHQKISHPTRSRLPDCPATHPVRLPNDPRTPPDDFPNGAGANREPVGNVSGPGVRARSKGTREQGSKGARDLGSREPGNVDPDRASCNAREARTPAGAITAAYAAGVPLADHARAHRTIALALHHGYPPDQVRRGIGRLIAEQRTCTPDTLRIAMDTTAVGAAGRARSTTDDRVAAAAALRDRLRTERLAAEHDDPPPRFRALPGGIA